MAHPYTRGEHGRSVPVPDVASGPSLKIGTIEANDFRRKAHPPDDFDKNVMIK